MYPVYVKDKDTKPPDAPIYYIVARNGLFLHIKNGWIETTIPVDEPLSLEDEKIRARLLLPPIDKVLVAKGIGFFYRVYQQHGAEAAVLFYHHPTKGWDVRVPEQNISPAHVKYDRMSTFLPGYRCIASMHSHHSMPAYHSHTDIGDEAENAGIHITIGRLDRFPYFELDAEVTLNGHRFKAPKSYFAHFLAPPEKKISTQVVDESQLNWPERIRRQQNAFVVPALEEYKVDLTLIDQWEVPEEWYKKLTVGSVASHVWGDVRNTAESFLRPVEKQPFFDRVLGLPAYPPPPRRRRRFGEAVAKTPEDTH